MAVAPEIFKAYDIRGLHGEQLDGDDPHGKLSNVPEALALVLSFVAEGQITDVCGEGPCHAPG